MLKSELQQLEMLIGQIVNYNETGAPIVPKELGSTLPKIKEACSHLRVKWVQELFSNVKETVIHRYVQFHQAGIISLSDHISVSYPHHSGEMLQTVYAEIVEQLEGLLSFLQSSFYKYFDPEHAVSAHQCQKEINKISALLADTVSGLLSAKIDQNLVNLIQQAISEVLEQAPHAGISYRKINYIKGILSFIREQNKTGSLTTDHLGELLYRNNFNSFYFERWYQNRINQLLRANSKNTSEIIENELARLNDRYIELNKSFDSERPSLDLLFTGWLMVRQTQEVEIIEKGRKGKSEPIRLPLNFSVAQFALFVRLCYLEGCFNLNNISSIQRFFTSHFETKKQLHISPKSFGRAFYGADQATAAVVRDVLMRMVANIDKIYFPKI